MTPVATKTETTVSVQQLKEMLSRLAKEAPQDMPDTKTQKQCNQMVRNFFLNKHLI
jgi:hypothetical protein